MDAISCKHELFSTIYVLTESEGSLYKFAWPMCVCAHTNYESLRKKLHKIIRKFSLGLDIIIMFLFTCEMNYVMRYFVLSPTVLVRSPKDLVKHLSFISKSELQVARAENIKSIRLRHPKGTREIVSRCKKKIPYVQETRVVSACVLWSL